jgi:hypothetical protein
VSQMRHPPGQAAVKHRLFRELQHQQLRHGDVGRIFMSQLITRDGSSR